MTEDIFTEDKFDPGYLKNISIKGLMSIKELENFELSKINILIGANGAGKSNFIEAFHLLGNTLSGRLDNYSKYYGDPAGLFFGGPETTDSIELGINYTNWSFQTEISLFRDNKIKSTKHNLVVNNLPKYASVAEIDEIYNTDDAIEIGDGREYANNRVISRREIINNSWRIFRLINEKREGLLTTRRRGDITDNLQLYHDFSNLAPILLTMKNQRLQDYKLLVNAIRLILPVFDDFIFQPQDHEDGARTVDLRWRHKDHDFIMMPYQLSQGSFSFIALAASMLQSNPPSVIIIDEPELGLHPMAMGLFADLVKNNKQESQIILATQSPTLVDNFSPEDIITVNHDKNGSKFQRMDPKDLSSWLEDYSLGELWYKNVIKAS